MLNPKLNILTVDDHPIFLTGIKNVLRKNPFVRSIFQAKNGMEAIKIVQNEKVDVILMDIDMPEMSGVETTEKILSLHPEMKIIVLTIFCEPRYIYEMSKLGAKGYLLKDSHP